MRASQSRNTTIRLTFVPALILMALGAGPGCKTQDGASGGGDKDKPAGLPAAPEMKTPPPVAQAQDEAETVPDAPDPAQSISGTITIADALSKKVTAGETMWLVVRPGDGRPGPPLAIQRLSVGTFPQDFTVSSRDAMIQGIPFAGQVDITVRVDQDGNPMTHSKGEVYGTVQGIKVGSADVTVQLDSVQAEDVRLGGGGPMGAPPPGHP